MLFSFHPGILFFFSGFVIVTLFHFIIVIIIIATTTIIVIVDVFVVVSLSWPSSGDETTTLTNVHFLVFLNCYFIPPFPPVSPSPRSYFVLRKAPVPWPLFLTFVFHRAMFPSFVPLLTSCSPHPSQ